MSNHKLRTPAKRPGLIMPLQESFIYTQDLDITMNRIYLNHMIYI